MKLIKKAGILVILVALFLAPGCKELKWKGHFKRANQYFNKKDFKNASIEYERTLESNPSLMPAHFYLAASYQALYRPSLDTQLFEDRSSKTVYKLALKEGVEKELAEKLAKLDTKNELQTSYYLLKAEWYKPLKGKDLRADLGYKADLMRIGENVSPAKLIEIYKEKFKKSLEEVKNEPEPKVEETEKEQGKESKKTKVTKTAKEETGKEKAEKEENKQPEEKEVKREDVGFALKYIENRLRAIGAIEHFTYYMNNVTSKEEKRKVIQSLAEIYDRKNDFKNAEKYYLEFFGENPSEPQYYYILAEFYNKYGHSDKAEEYYKKRIEMDPTNPEGWLYLANFYSNQVKMLPKEMKKEIFDKAIELMDKSIEAHEKRIELIPEPVIKDGVKIASVPLDKLPEGLVFPKEMKDKISYDEANKTLTFKGNMTTVDKDNLSKLSQDPTYQKALNLLYESSNKEKAYYYLAVVCWAKSYNIRRIMTLKDRVSTLKKGLKALDKALELNPNYAAAHVYKNLIYREFAKTYPSKAKKNYYMKLAQQEIEKYKEIISKREAKKKALESLSKE